MRIKPIYFIVAFAILVSACYFIGERQLFKDQIPVNNLHLIFVAPNDISDSISDKTCAVFFYIPNSDICKNMEYKLNSLDINKGKYIPIYAINMDKETTIADKYNISGVPCILLFKNGQEYKRIMGVVSAYNLRMIYERDAK